MDAIDRKILALLQANGRMTFTELAAEVQLSVSRCQRRVRDLRADGVIRDYRGVIDAKKVGLGFEVIAFATLAHPDAIHDFDLAVEAVPEIVEAQRLFGEPDYFIRIVAADREAYQRLYDERLSKLPGLRSLNSTIVMKEVVAARGLPLDHGR
ncbi:MAG TPA: Lrp/AsnC family transcriptional regulator [Candidatus Brevibacterium intestinavium]|jgi:DNA-binding Lrp family transcriptional regulator|uniref:Lrp/AsnC family transcriptional regulator n=1 Tax=Brevibacterium sp. TaxID=1701 RepID=UPI001F99E589|nr:Lrp/AsnC family transcriptional regulator [Brevibacterium sp.]HJA60782.1 Lrp/AsnC family transcriptional regulator [Candidatus Brevibacterium intestinavium]